MRLILVVGSFFLLARVVGLAAMGQQPQRPEA